MELIVSAVVNLTESKEKVLKAVENMFPSLEFKEKGPLIQAKGKDKSDLAAFKELLKQQIIRDAARGFMMDKIDGCSLFFGLNKQAAFMGKVSFVDFEIALGTIDVEIRDKDDIALEGIIDWVTQK